jgi:type IV secretory pathway VirB6-like protein
MSYDTMQTQYALKDLIRRLAFAGIMINASLSLADQLAGSCNALAAAFLGDGATAAATAASLQNLIVGALSGGGIFLILLGLGCAVAAVMLLVLYLLRAAIVVVLVCAAPLVLLAHLFPQTEGLAHLWWRVMAAAFAVQVSQAIVLAACVRVFFSGGPAGLGLSVTGSVVDLLLCLCLLYVLVRIPFWAKQIAFGGRGSSTVRLVKAYAVGRAIGTVL